MKNLQVLNQNDASRSSGLTVVTLAYLDMCDCISPLISMVLMLLAGLTIIQQAAIDYLVIINTLKFVGFSASSFSCFVKFIRLQLGYPLATNMLIGNAHIERAYQLL